MSTGLFKNKRQLLVEVMNFAVTDDADSPRVLDLERPRAVREEKDQRRQIAMFAHEIAPRVDRARPIDDVMRSAAAVDESVAEKHRGMGHQAVRSVAAADPGGGAAETDRSVTDSSKDRNQEDE